MLYVTCPSWTPEGGGSPPCSCPLSYLKKTVKISPDWKGQIIYLLWQEIPAWVILNFLHAVTSRISYRIVVFGPNKKGSKSRYTVPARKQAKAHRINKTKKSKNQKYLFLIICLIGKVLRDLLSCTVLIIQFHIASLIQWPQHLQTFAFVVDSALPRTTGTRYFYTYILLPNLLC